MRKYGMEVAYAAEMAELVRENIVDRDEAVRRLSEPADAQVIEQVKARLIL